MSLNIMPNFATTETLLQTGSVPGSLNFQQAVDDVADDTAAEAGLNKLATRQVMQAVGTYTYAACEGFPVEPGTVRILLFPGSRADLMTILFEVYQTNGSSVQLDMSYDRIRCSRHCNGVADWSFDVLSFENC